MLLLTVSSLGPRETLDASIKLIMKFMTLGLALALLYPAVNAAAKYSCEDGTDHHVGKSCHGDIGHTACNGGNVVSYSLFQEDNASCQSFVNLLYANRSRCF